MSSRKSVLKVAPSADFTYQSNNILDVYLNWEKLLQSYRTLRKGKKTIASRRRLQRLRKEVFVNYIKHFFSFSLLIFRLILPSYMKGKVTVWTNLRTIAREKEFRPLRIAFFSQLFFLYLVIHVGIVVFRDYATPVFAATYTWVQSTWSGGATTSTPVHPGNQTGWSGYSSASSTVSASSSIALIPVGVSTTQTSDTDFAGGTFSQTVVSGSGSSTIVQLTSTSTPANSWDSVIPAFPETGVNDGSKIIRNGSDDEIYVFEGSLSTGFYKYSISSNTWTALAPVPATLYDGDAVIRNGSDDEIYVFRAISGNFYRYSISGNSWTALSSAPGSGGAGTQMIRNGADDDIYLLRAGGQTSFYRYSISGNSWATLTAVPGTVGAGAQMIRNSSDNDIYVLRGNSQTSFYRYSISGNSWTTLTVVPGTVGVGAQMIRNSSDNDIYVLRGGGQTSFYRYSISGNSWSTLTAVPGAVAEGGDILRNGADNDIYVMQGNFTSNFYRYSISGNSWSTLTAVPESISYGAQMIRNGADDDIYVFGASFGDKLHRYSVSGNSWISSTQSNLTDVPGAVGLGAQMIRNGADDDIYVLRGGSTSTFYKYSISTNSWTTLASAPGTIGVGAQMIRNGSDNDIYVLRGNSQTSFYRYSISGNSWTTLTVLPGVVDDGGAMIRNGSDNDIYVIAGGATTTFYRYSISGNSWTTLAPTPGGINTGAKMIRNASDNEIYLTRGSGTTAFYRYSISGNSWTTLTVVPGGLTTGSQMIRNGSDNDIYVLRGTTSDFYKYSISGNSWTTLGQPPKSTIGVGAQMIRNGSDNDIYVLRGNSADFFRYRFNVLTYDTPGSYTSAVIDTSGNSGFGLIDFTSSTSFGTVLSVDVRAGDVVSPDETWTAWQTSVADGGNISALGNRRYVQYRVNLSTTNSSFTPSLSDITLGYFHFTSGSLISSPYNAGDSTNVVGGISWNATIATGTAVKFQLRTSANNSVYTAWAGPDGTDTTYFTNSNGDQDIPSIFNNGENDQWIQYQAFLESDGRYTPLLTSTTLTYVVNAPPDIHFVTSSPILQSNDGTVSVTYEVRDLDTASGFTPGYVVVDLQYCTSNCSSVGNEVWSTASTSTLTGNYGSLAVAGAEYTSYTMTWNPKVAYNNHYNGTDFKIRLLADDNEAANNSSNVESDIFTLDTKDPVVDFSIDARSNAPHQIIIDVTDDSVAGLMMKLSNDSDLSSDGVNASSGNWVSYVTTSTWNFSGLPTTMYYQIRDAYGNVSSNGAISSVATPNIPQNMVYRDVSNSDTSEWREFVAWGVVPIPTSGFKQYTVYRSTNGVSYSVLTTETDRSVNYFLDDSLDTNTTYYYKVVAEDNNDNISNYSTIISDIPDGQGGSDATPPTITNVTSTSVGTQSVTITWDTDELANSYVDYITAEGGDFSNAPSVGVSSMLDTASGLGKHTVVLTELAPNTTYYFQVRSFDAQGNEGMLGSAPNGFSFTTLLGPSISNVAVSNVINKKATITWTTDEVSDSYVHYSSDPSFSSSTLAGLAESVNDHSVIVSNLTPGTTYYYYVKSGVAEDKNIVDGVVEYYTFTSTADLEAPSIIFDSENDVAVSDSVINLSWITNEAATSTVEYGTSNSYGTFVSNDNYNTNHPFELEDLLPGTLYYLRIKSMDVNGNISSAIEFTALTIDTTDSSPPVITGVTTSVITDDEALIEWDTDEAATGQVHYGIASGIYDDTSDTVSTYNRAHAITLSGLSTSTEYYYIVVSVDSSGNSTTSTEYSFTTLEQLSEESEVELREETARAEGAAQGSATSVRSGGGGGTPIDRTAPVSRAVEVGNITSDAAVLTWASDEAGDSIVEFGVDTTYGQASVDLQDSVSHRVSLIKLDPETLYYYRISTADSSGNRSPFIEGTFTTLSTAADIESIVSSTPGSVLDEDAQNIFLLSIQKATDLIRSLSTQVDVSVLENTLTQQNKFIEDLSTLLPLPIIGGQPVTEIGSNYATISWTTDKLSNSLVAYAPANDFTSNNTYTQTVGDFLISTNEHSVEIRGLLPDTVYHYHVISRTPTGAETQSRDFTFKTKMEFSEVNSHRIDIVSPEEASFFWTSTLPTNSLVTYIPYRAGVLDVEAKKTFTKPNFSIEHMITVSDFEAGLIYDVELSGTDYSGNIISKTIKGFSTSKTDLAPLIFQIQTESSIIPGNKEKIQVIISWNTNELSTSRVFYRKGFAAESSSFDQSTVLDLGYVKKHIVVISNFESGQVYQFAVESTDSGGNTSMSKIITILTPQKEESVFQVIMNNVEDIFSWTRKLRR
ncbi:MAG TPA: fibronectin type III domain-containing protein [Candidatus Magasanikbacteria bacterium]|nr:fibronectin type III domain-containing protein [Candidatus Magasanikbacteria bacterium]